MASGKTIAVSGGWVLVHEAGRSVLRRNASVVVEGATVAAVVDGQPAADIRIGGERSLVVPGFVNLHTHCVNAPLFRGAVDDADSVAAARSRIYGLLMPVGDLAARELSREEYGALFAIGLLEALKGGATTVLDMWRPEQDVFFEVARALGIRAYACPYIFSTRTLRLGSDGRPVYEPAGGGSDSLAQVLDLHRRFDGDADGRLRVALGPHATESCGPELLREIRAAADRLGCRISIHVAQSQFEIQEIRRRYGKSPVEYLRDVGLLGPDLVAAHGIYATDEELAILRDTGTPIATCPRVFARGGAAAAYDRFASSGVRTGIGTDSPTMDMLGELRAAGFVSKLRAGSPHVATAPALLEAATIGGADALGRPDLGRIAPGARADLLVVDLDRPHLAPARDPIKTLVWYATPADITSILVDGELLVHEGRFLGEDERAIVARGRAAADKVWDLAARRGLHGGA